MLVDGYLFSGRKPLVREAVPLLNWDRQNIGRRRMHERQLSGQVVGLNLRWQLEVAFDTELGRSRSGWVS